jgi:G:T-mismatch repair DNA endonuclease (very short patch repair protein)
MEIDIYLPAARLGIEVNGSYWHSEKRRQQKGNRESVRDNLRRKTDLCANRGISVVFVWEEDWKHARTEVEAALKHFLLTEEPAPILRRCEPRDAPFEVGLFALQ